LFGQARAGSSEGQPGRFVEADGGTLLLDDVTALPFAVQGKLLRVLQDRAVKPMGDARIRQVNTRVLAATNQDPEALVREGKFRADLSSGSTWCPSPCPRCAREPRTFHAWPSIFWHWPAVTRART